MYILKEIWLLLMIAFQPTDVIYVVLCLYLIAFVNDGLSTNGFNLCCSMLILFWLLLMMAFQPLDLCWCSAYTALVFVNDGLFINRCNLFFFHAYSLLLMMAFQSMDVIYLVLSFY